LSANVDLISQYFGPDLVAVGRRRTSFAEAWNNPKLRTRAIGAARHALNVQRRELGIGACQQIARIADLLLDVLLEEAGGGPDLDRP
jgi:hypothetical protein